MPYFAQLTAPALEGQGPSLRTRVEVGLVFHGRQAPADDTTARLFTALLLTIDKAAREYGWGRESLLRHQTDGGITPFVEGLGHFENCINAVKRALRLLDRLKRQPSAPTADRLAHKLASGSSEAITEARNSIEHMDEQIGSPEGPQGREPHLLAIDPGGERLEIGRWSISFRQLASTINALLRVGDAMINSLPTPKG